VVVSAALPLPPATSLSYAFLDEEHLKEEHLKEEHLEEEYLEEEHLEDLEE
jgi:hypothetical protein